MQKKRGNLRPVVQRPRVFSDRSSLRREISSGLTACSRKRSAKNRTTSRSSIGWPGPATAWAKSLKPSPLMQRVAELRFLGSENRRGRAPLSRSAGDESDRPDFGRRRKRSPPNAFSGEPDYVPALMVQAALQSQKNERERAQSPRIPESSRATRSSPLPKRSLPPSMPTSRPRREKAYQLATAARQTLPDDAELTATWPNSAIFEKTTAARSKC